MGIHRFGRRDFLTSAALAAGALAGAPLGWASPQDDADAVFDRSLVFDALSSDDEWTDEVFTAFRRSGVSAIQTSLDNRTLASALADLARWQARFDHHADRLVKVVRGGDIADARRQGRVAVVLGFQNATMIGTDVGNLDELHALGARCIQLTYNARNLLGDGCTERTNAGLSDFGVSVVHRMNELGIVVDLSHCGEQTTRDAIELSARPPAFTHTMCKAVYDHVRAKSDELLRSLADKGGVVGIVMLGYFVGPTAETNLDDYLNHIDHAVKVAGIDHVGLATDFSMRGIEATATRETWYVPRLTTFKPSYRVRWPPWVKGLDPPERYRNVARGLAKRGYRAGTIEQILGGNWTRYFSDIIGG